MPQIGRDTLSSRKSFLHSDLWNTIVNKYHYKKFVLDPLLRGIALEIMYLSQIGVSRNFRGNLQARAESLSGNCRNLWSSLRNLPTVASQRAAGETFLPQNSQILSNLWFFARHLGLLGQAPRQVSIENFWYGPTYVICQKNKKNAPRMGYVGKSWVCLKKVGVTRKVFLQ